MAINTGVGRRQISAAGVELDREGAGASLVRSGTVIAVGPPEAESRLAEKLQKSAAEVHAIGDSTGFALSKKAVKDALEIAYRI